MTDELMQDQAALYVLDLLDAGEKAAFETRMRLDSGLRAQVDDLREAAAAVSHASPLRELPRGFEQRVLDAIGESEKIIPFRRPVPWIPWAIAAVLAAVCVVLSLNLRESGQSLAETQNALNESRSSLNTSQNTLKQFENALTSSSKALATAENELIWAKAPKMKVSILEPADKTASRENAVVVWDEKNQSGLVRLNSVPGLEAGKDYQLWVIDPAYKAPVSAGVIHAAAGQGAVEFHAVMPIRDAQKFAISIEKAGGSAEPGGPIVFISD